MKNCPKGEYYCFMDKKCKSIPKGYHVMSTGKLMKDSEHDEIDEANKSGDSSLHDWFSKSRSSDDIPGWVQLGGKYAGKPCAKQPGQTTKPKCGSSKMKKALSKDEEEAAFRRKNRQDPNPDRKGKAINVTTEETKKDNEFSMARSELKTIKNATKRLEKKMGKRGEGNLEAWVQSKITKSADYIDTAADYVTNEAVGEKDACYKKVKSRYKVWPSAYASGALVKCRRVGAANWGNSTKKEEFSNWRQELEGLVSIEDANGNTFAHVIDIIKTPSISEAVRLPAKTGNLLLVTLTWRGKYYDIKMFFPHIKTPSRKDVQDQIEKVYPGAKVQSYHVSDYNPGEQFLQTEDWQSVNRKDKTDGLSQKAVDAYRRENPGSKLQTAVTEKNPTGKRANRRKSFCRRMRGMKSKLTSAETSRDPDSRINKALRRWNCN